MDDLHDSRFLASKWPSFLRFPVFFRAFDYLRDCFRDRRERRFFAARSIPDRAERILLIRDRGFGDILQLTTILDDIRDRFCASQLDFMTSDLGETVLCHDRRVDNVLRTDSPPQNFADSYDLIINFHIFDNSPVAKEAVLTVPREKLLGYSYRDGEEWYRYLAGGCWLRKYCRIADIPFRESMPLEISIARDPGWGNDAGSFAERYLSGVDRNKLISVCLGGADWHRNYSISYLQKMLISLSEKGYQVVLVGLRVDRSEHEREELKRMFTGMSGAIDFTDKLTMRELLFCLEASKVLVTCDTGPIHMAIGVSTPVVALFGHTPGTQLLGPIAKSDSHSILTPLTGCRCCGYRLKVECASIRKAMCMDRISVDNVLLEVARLVGVTGKPLDKKVV